MTYIVFSILFFPLILSILQLMERKNNFLKKIYWGIVIEMSVLSVAFWSKSIYGREVLSWESPFGSFSLTSSSGALLIIINVIGLILIWSDQLFHEKNQSTHLTSYFLFLHAHGLFCLRRDICMRLD